MFPPSILIQFCFLHIFNEQSGCVSHTAVSSFIPKVLLTTLHMCKSAWFRYAFEGSKPPLPHLFFFPSLLPSCSVCNLLSHLFQKHKMMSRPQPMKSRSQPTMQETNSRVSICYFFSGSHLLYLTQFGYELCYFVPVMSSSLHNNSVAAQPGYQLTVETS